MPFSSEAATRPPLAGIGITGGRQARVEIKTAGRLLVRPGRRTKRRYCFVGGGADGVGAPGAGEAGGIGDIPPSPGLSGPS